MIYAIDTSVLIALEKNEKYVINGIRELPEFNEHQPQISFITYFEFILGIKSKMPHNQKTALEFLNRFNCLKASKITAEILAGLKYKYDKKGISIPLADLIIASQVKENNATLITKDKIFDNIEEINKIIL